MRTIVETIPEYKVLRSMPGVGDCLGPVMLGEIDDICRFYSGKALHAYAGNDAPPLFSDNRKHWLFQKKHLTNIARFV